MISKPMLAGKLEFADLSKVKYPVAVTPKLDGIRCLKIGKALSRSFKDIPNAHIQALVSAIDAENLDGELMVGDKFQETTSGVMSEDGTPKFEYWVFDYVKDSLTRPYMKRMEDLASLKLPKFCKKVIPWIANDEEELLKFAKQFLDQGFEGIMLRTLNSPYKCGRSSVKEGFLLKLKPMEDSEAKIIAFEELMHNSNEAEKDELGHTKRSTAKDGMVPMDSLGKFVVVEVGDTPWKGQEFRIGTGKGLTAELRKEIWDNQKKYMGKIVKYTYQKIGTLDLPRIPIWIGFRDERDM